MKIRTDASSPEFNALAEHRGCNSRALKILAQQVSVEWTHECAVDYRFTERQTGVARAEHSPRVRALPLDHYSLLARQGEIVPFPSSLKQAPHVPFHYRATVISLAYFMEALTLASNEVSVIGSRYSAADGIAVVNCIRQSECEPLRDRFVTCDSCASATIRY